MGDRKKLRQEADEKMLKDLVLKNRSYRGFDESVRISRETLEGFVDCARLCPSSVNKQPLKYFLAWEPEEEDKGIDENLNRYQKDVGIVAQTMLLAAVEQGLGGCMIGNFQAGEVMEVLGLPEEIRPLLIVAFGKPAEEIHLVDVPEDGNTNYYRDENDVHYVPKRTLADELLN